MTSYETTPPIKAHNGANNPSQEKLNCTNSFIS